MSFWMTGGARRLKQKRKSASHFSSGGSRQKTRASKNILNENAALQQQKSGNNIQCNENGVNESAQILGQQQLLCNSQVGGLGGLSSNRVRGSMVTAVDLLQNNSVKRQLLEHQFQQQQQHHQQQQNLLNNFSVESYLDTTLPANQLNRSSNPANVIDIRNLSNFVQQHSLGMNNLNDIQNTLNLNAANNNASDMALLDEYRRLLGLSNDRDGFIPQTNGNNYFVIPNSPAAASHIDLSYSSQGNGDFLNNDCSELSSDLQYPTSTLNSIDLGSTSPQAASMGLPVASAAQNQNLLNTVLEMKQKRNLLDPRQDSSFYSTNNKQHRRGSSQAVMDNTARMRISGDLHGVSRFQNRANSKSENVSSVLCNNQMNGVSIEYEQKLRYFNNGAEVNAFGDPVQVSPESMLDSLPPLYQPATEHMINHTNQAQLSSSAKVQNNAEFHTTIGELIDFICTEIPEIETTIRPLASNETLAVGHISSVLSEINHIFDDKILNVLQDEARNRILNCVRIIESLKQGLENNNSNFPLQPQRDTEKSWILFGKEIDSKCDENVPPGEERDTTEKNNLSLFSNSRQKDRPNSSSSQSKQHLKLNSSSSRVTSSKIIISPKPQLDRKRKCSSLSNKRQHYQKSCSSHSKPEKICGPHSNLLDELFGAEGEKKPPSSSQIETDLEISAAHALLNFTKA